MKVGVKFGLVKYYMLKIPNIVTILYICKQKEITTPK